MTKEPHDPSAFSDQDLYLWNEGTHFRLYDKLGAHIEDGRTRFAGSGSERRGASPSSVTGTDGIPKRIRWNH